MPSKNHDKARGLQRDARAWAKFTGSNYTAAVRQMQHPLAQGILGDRISARHLIRVLDEHPLIGARLGESGFRSADPLTPRVDDFVALALTVETLRMFTPDPRSQINSYPLKGLTERFLEPTVSYVSNGRLIWAAAALDLPMVEASSQGPNVYIGINEREDAYIRIMTDHRKDLPKATQHRPPGFVHLRGALERYASGEPIGERWSGERPQPVTTAFHKWLVQQADRDAPYVTVEQMAFHYVTGVADSDHRIATDPEDLVSILTDDVGASPDFIEAAVRAGDQWRSNNAPPLSAN